MSLTEVGFLAYGVLLDFYEIWLQENKLRTPYRETFIDEIM